MLPDQVWQLSNHLAVAGGGQPIYTVVLGNQIWIMKSGQGFPWDMNTFDEHYVYQSITELNWTDPKTFKMFASSSWPTANGGIVWAPRNMSPNPIITGDSSYRLYSDCTHFVTQNLGGPILIMVSTDPELIDFGGDLGKQLSIAQYYLWGKGLATMEINRYVEKFGLVQWELWGLLSGIYVQQQVSAFNHFMTGPLPQPVFPCGVPKI
jgi:hypothetical protein